MSDNAKTGVSAGSPMGLHVQWSFGLWQRNEVKLLSHADPGTVVA